MYFAIVDTLRFSTDCARMVGGALTVGLRQVFTTAAMDFDLFPHETGGLT